ncbi:MAG: hypothetical protein DWQ31_21540 [Planctomycetota bacterium]|nr:MAG: hypothetical protein DWQ31_21540 [Planctomycetota bacterium]REJ93688.1 MAG: hypothetical protein DWQ35_10075 [Planctomycetota bacterium]
MLLACLTAGITFAAPLDTERVPADVKWLVHIDFDALRDSEMGQKLAGPFLSHRGPGAKIRKLQQELGIDLTADLHSVTLYDTRFQRHHGLMQIRTNNLDQGRLLSKLREKHPDAAATDYRGHAIHTWVVGEGRKFAHEMSGCFHGEDTLLLSRDTDVLKRTIEVLDGAGESLPVDAELAAATVGGTILSMNVNGMVPREFPFRSPVMRQTKRLFMTVGESEGEVRMRAHLEANSSDTAENLATVVEGFRAMGMLRHGDDETGKRVFDGLTVEVDGATVEANWIMTPEDAEKVVDTMKKEHEKHREMRRERMERRREMMKAKREKS